MRRDCPRSIFGDFEVCGGGVETVDDGDEHIFSGDSHSFFPYHSRQDGKTYNISRTT